MNGQMDLPKPNMLQPEHTTTNGQYFGSRIDFISIVLCFYKHRWTILAATAAAAVIGWLFSFFITPTYQVRTSIVAPRLYMYENLLHNSDMQLKGTGLFKLFVKKLEQRGNIIDYLSASGIAQKVFAEKGISTEKAKIRTLNKLADAYRVSVIRKNNSENKVKNKEVMKDNSLEADLITVSPVLSFNADKNIEYLEYTNNRILDDLVRDKKVMVQLSIEKLQKEMVKDIAVIKKKRQNTVELLKDKRAIQLASLNDSLVAMTMRDTRDKQYRLENLKHALVIARRLGIVNGYDRPQRVGDKAVVIDINNRNDLYLRGTRYLEKEIELIESRKQSLAYSQKVSALQEKLYKINNDRNILALEKRINDEPYTKGIIEKKAAIEHLKGLTFNTKDVKAYQIAGAPDIDTRPTSPNRTLFMLAGLFIGFMISVAVALALDAKTLFTRYHPGVDSL
ncbi:LPS O-antigen length regulator [Legionella geestiana]|uniref:LPS O-antigen length regulator n=1 Tax=Legionella geestiana TaxID=45065 RepID=A0A0W0U9C7_9GAMM|nr:Wzz/FepE/Etk N-terminal domain-containing protein [Legionella geestiana]KTD04512.1 LPS O-antigen length regulator [Legionella geestiana]QBS12281.1 hypothetical protein E4T54_05700 [Legionella geestiana]STX52984.1 LPS O-antigen length regulator [Legionella geestiana]